MKQAKKLHQVQTQELPPTSLKYIWLLSGLIFLVVFFVFSNTLKNSFLWDDEQFIVKNTFLTSTRFLPKLLMENIVAGAGLESNLYRPLQSLTHFLDVQLWAYRAWGHHLTNVLIHAALAVALFRLLLTLLSLWPAVFAALIFSLHPLQSEAVAYVSGRGDLLAILFLCLGLFYFKRNLWFSCLFAAFAMFSKESLALFPLFLLLYDRTLVQQHSSAVAQPYSLKRHLPLWGVSGAYVLARLTILNFKDTLNFYDKPNILTENFLARLYTYFTTIPKGLLLWFWPIDLHHERSWPVFTDFSSWQVFLGAALVVVFLSLAIWLIKKKPLISAGVFLFFLATIPTSNLFVLINAVFYDHWFILPGFGFICVFGFFLSKAYSRFKASTVTVAIFLVSILSFFTIRYNRIWRSPISLYTHIVSFEPGSTKITNNLAMAYADKGNLEEALRLYKRAIELFDEYPQTHHNLANVYLNLGQEDLALGELEKAIQMDPNFYHSYIIIGLIQLKNNKLNEASKAFEEAMRAYPYDPRAYLGAAQTKLLQGDKKSAREILELGLKHLPNNPSLKIGTDPILGTVPARGTVP